MTQQTSLPTPTHPAAPSAPLTHPPAAPSPAPASLAATPAGAVVDPTTETTSDRSHKRLAVRSHSQVIYFFPTLLAAAVSMFMAPSSGAAGSANLFLAVFFGNLLFVLFDFNSLRTLIATLFLLVGGFAAYSFGLMTPLTDRLGLLDATMNTHAFALFALFLGALVLGDYVWSHLNRWEFSANEVKHIQAFRGHTANYPGRGLRFQVRTKDVFERLLLGAGTIVLLVGRKKVLIPNVIFAHRKVRKLESFIRTTGVFTDEDDVFDDDLEDEDDL